MLQLFVHCEIDILNLKLLLQLLVEKKAELLADYYDPSSLLCSDEVLVHFFISLIGFLKVVGTWFYLNIFAFILYVEI